MRSSRLFRRVFWVSFLVALVSVSAIAAWAFRVAKRQFTERTLSHLTTQAHLLAETLTAMSLEDRMAVDALCKRLGRRTGFRYTVVLPTGEVLGDSLEQPLQMENHARRPEVQEALQGRSSAGERFSRTLQRTFQYGAVPVWRQGSVVAVARAALSRDRGHEDNVRFQGAVLPWVWILLTIAAFASWVLAARVDAPVRALCEAAQRLANGERTVRASVLDEAEVGEAARALNRLAQVLEEWHHTAEREREERGVALARLQEGVVLLDDRRRVRWMNPAAAHWFGSNPKDTTDRPFQEVARSAPLQAFVERLLESGQVEEEEIELAHDPPRTLRVYGQRLSPHESAGGGLLIVLQDITAWRRVKQAQREFLANAAHELKTPLSSLQAALETLLQTPVEDITDREALFRILERHLNRLSKLVEDLLLLSRLDQEVTLRTLQLQRMPLRPVLEAATEVWQPVATRKGVRIEIEAPVGLEADLHEPLFEQAVSNLLDNAVKYAPEGSVVRVEADLRDDGLEVRVRDEGCGIAAEHLPRLFERFYRVDSSRSRQLGGTGLGLAIVKHIAQVHGGRVSVDSAPGRGSTFTIHLPPPRDSKPATPA